MGGINKTKTLANVFDDENDLLSDMSFPHIDHISPMKSKATVGSSSFNNEPLKKQ